MGVTQGPGIGMERIGPRHCHLSAPESSERALFPSGLQTLSCRGSAVSTCSHLFPFLGITALSVLPDGWFLKTIVLYFFPGFQLFLNYLRRKVLL